MRVRVTSVIAVAAALAALLGAAAAQDRHVGYYYPEPQSQETYSPRVFTLPDSSRLRRIGFVTAMTTSMMERPYPPSIALFAKGAEAEKLIIVSLVDDRFNSLYRMRALFAMMTAVARTTATFQQTGYEEDLTFFDLLAMLGFEQLTFTDGHDFAHQVFFR